MLPLTLTILSDAVPKERRGLALGAWGAIAGLAIALGPLVGGAIVEGLSWQFIFWVNVPIGIVLVPLAIVFLRETHGPDGALDLPGLGLVSGGLFALVWGLIHGNEQGWTSTEIVTAFVAATLLLVAFVAWEARASNPMLPLRFFRNRAFSAANVVSLLMSFGLFGSIFLLAQFFQVVQGYSPLEAGLRTLPWTMMPIFVAPIAGVLSDRIGSRPLLVTGMVLMSLGLAWIATISTPTVEYLAMVPAFIISGIGMSLFFAPTANLVLSAVRPEEEGRASGVNNTIREIGGVFGVAILASVFSANGGYTSPQAFVDGMIPAVWVGAAVLAVAAVAATFVPGRSSVRSSLHLPRGTGSRRPGSRRRRSRCAPRTDHPGSPAVCAPSRHRSTSPMSARRGGASASGERRRWPFTGPSAARILCSEQSFGPVGMRGFDRAWLSGNASRGAVRPR